LKVKRPPAGKSAVKPRAGVPAISKPSADLRRAESDNPAKFTTLFKNMRQGVFYQAADGSFIDVNPAALKMLGLTKREFLSRDSSRPQWLVIREDGSPLPGPEHPSMIALKTGKPVKDFVLGLPHGQRGETVWLSVNAVPEFRRGEKKAFRVAVTLHDLTAVKRGEVALSDMEIRYQALFSGSPFGIGIADAGARFLEVNKALCRMLGYSRKELIGRDVLGLTHPDERDLTAARFGDVAAGRSRGYRAEKRYLKKDGSPLWVQVTTIPVYSPAGAFLYGLGIIENIDERKKIEEAFRENRERYQGLFENIREAVAVYEAVDGGKDFVFRDFNPAAEAIEHVPRKTLIGRRVTEVFPGVEAFGLLEILRRVWSSGRTEAFPAHVYKDAHDPGTWRENEVYKLPSGEIVAVYRDVTERKRTENTLREDEARYRTLFESANDGIHLLRDSIFVDCNQRALEMFGCVDKSELSGLSPVDLSPPFQPDGQASAAMARAHIEAALSGVPQRFVWRHLRMDGSPFEAEIALNKVELENAVFIQAVVRDVSERNRAEEQIRQSLHEKETLLREVYHRTKNNMNVIGSMMSLRARALGDEKTTAVFREIENKIRVMALVHKKLYESKDLSRIDLRDYIAELTEQLIASHRDRDTALRADLDLTSIPVPIDIAIPCGMILNELFSNAAKHAFREAERGKIRIRLARADRDEIELDFADNGVGVPANFDFRAQSSLGLQTLIMLVEHQLQGSIRFEPGSDGGLACRIRIPEKPDPAGGSS
jgi:PAS domain S-box-containing protein